MANVLLWTLMSEDDVEGVKPEEKICYVINELTEISTS